MHEAAIAQSIINLLSEQIVGGQISGKINRVYLKIGKLTAVVPENLEFMYSVLSDETDYKGSSLEIDIVPVSCRCEVCQRDFEVLDLEFWCPACRSTQVKIITGRELLITSVEVDDGG